MNLDRSASRLASRSVLVAALLPALCFAHVGNDAAAHHGAAAALAAGIVHPFTGLDHLAAMLALGIWSALTAKRVWLAPLVFAGTLALGAWAGLAGMLLPSVEPMIAASLLVLGLLLSSGMRLPAIGGAAVAAVFALFHGAAHGQELAGHDTLAAITGMVAATALLHTLGIGLGPTLKQRSVWLPRAAGAAVALFGVTLLAQLA